MKVPKLGRKLAYVCGGKKKKASYINLFTINQIFAKLYTLKVLLDFLLPGFFMKESKH